MYLAQKKLLSLQPDTSLSELEKIFTTNKRLGHLWKEYQDTLHKQFEERDGQMTVIAVRATVPAEIYFNDSSLVDSWLKTEFFKHLPDIFTGMGIIGTFIGLINGLKAFQVTEDAAMARASLESLMHAVGEAFLISASAIIAAMVVTFLEKLLLASLYRRTEEIGHAIDARFDAGCSGAVQEALRDYRAQRDAIAQLLTEVKATIDLARKEASLTGEALQRIEHSALKLGAAQKAVDEYLDGVSEILAESSESFRNSVVNTLGKVNHEFHQKLSSAVGLLSAAVQELEVSLAGVGVRR